MEAWVNRKLDEIDDALAARIDTAPVMTDKEMLGAIDEMAIRAAEHGNIEPLRKAVSPARAISSPA